MKQFLILMTAGLILTTACTTAPDADQAKTTDKQQATTAKGASYAIDTAASEVSWVGTKQNGQHNGSFDLTAGSLQVDNGNLTGGKFDINVASLSVNDLKGEEKGKLEGHLKSPDFFQADKFPSAKFEITKVEPFDKSKVSELPGATHVISGNLTLKDSTKNVTFPAKINIDGNIVEAAADFNIDRTEWGINYKGPNNPQDWLIKKEVNLKIALKANLNEGLSVNNK